MLGLETVWFQVGGTICNLRCHHCFISCSPENDKFGFLSLETVARYLEEARELGAREYYFTGGEPFANPQMCDILERTLRYGPATVLTNATLFRSSVLKRLEAMRASAPHPLELRVSLDGYTAEMNDPIRGEGTFDRAMDGICRLVECGFRPIITITRTWGCSGLDDEVLAGFRQSLIDLGYAEPRLKVLPLLKLGAETQRSGGYGRDAWITREMMEGYDHRNLQCSRSRLVTDKGVWVCPILPDSPAARMGDTLRESLRDYPLRHHACHTCYHFGAICSNATTAAGRECEA
ncbi:MAG: radical SAM protein [Planctomycetota bacterium]|nr:MAG: radical SAM protein [Planctomycetota bacterium]